ncbi:hypothetical protein P3T26_001215 [Streptomyces sp. MAA16]|nr:hypothetical protein [Streptomyces sp. MAA16]
MGVRARARVQVRARPGPSAAPAGNGYAERVRGTGSPYRYAVPVPVRGGSRYPFCSTRTQSTSACTPPPAIRSTLDWGRPQYGVVVWFQPAG